MSKSGEMFCIEGRGLHLKQLYLSSFNKKRIICDSLVYLNRIVRIIK